MTIIPCGPPNPRNAVWDVLLVLAIRPFTRTFGIQYALSMWQRAWRERFDRSRLSRRRRSASRSRPAVGPSWSNPTRHSAWNPCRFPDIVMSMSG